MVAATRTSPVAGALVLALAAALPSCLVVTTRSGGPLPADLPRPGDDRSALLARLGPPRELARPSPFVPWLDLAWEPQVTRVEVERELFDRRAWTWLDEERRERAFELPPRNPVATTFLFRVRLVGHGADRVVALLDGDGRVAAVARGDTR